MYKIEEIHCNAAINAILNANLHLMLTTVEDAVPGVRYGKPDTLGLDGITEARIIDELRNFDKNCIVITEEVGSNVLKSFSYYQNHHYHPPTFYLCDPTDRSNQFKKYLEDSQKPTEEIGKIITGSDIKKDWEEKYGSPVSITGSVSSICCIRHGLPIATVVLIF